MSEGMEYGLDIWGWEGGGGSVRRMIAFLVVDGNGDEGDAE